VTKFDKRDLQLELFKWLDTDDERVRTSEKVVIFQAGSDNIVPLEPYRNLGIKTVQYDQLDREISIFA
jgi:hypothetical protein